MSFTEDQKKQLGSGLSKNLVRTREQSGVKLSYIEGHEAIRAMNRIFGHDGWDRKTVEDRIVQEELKGDKWYVGYIGKCRLIVQGETYRTGCGFGQGIDRDLGRAHESAYKEMETDAFKRAAMTLGDPLGLALYDKDQKHVTTPAKERTGTLDETAPFGWKPERMPSEAEVTQAATPQQQKFFAEHCARSGVKNPTAFRSFLCRAYGLSDPHGKGGNSLGIDFFANATDDVLIRATDAYADALANTLKEQAAKC